MPKHMTLASMLVTMRHAEEKLGARAAADAGGAELLHDIRDLLLSLEVAEESPPPALELRALANAAASLHERVVDYVLHRERAERAPPRLPSDPVLSSDEIARAHEAHAGPSAETMAECPACSGCLLCADKRFVSVGDAVEWRKRNAPKG